MTEKISIEDVSSVDAEIGLIGALLLDNLAYDRISDKLKPEHFFVDQHREIFIEITRQIIACQTCDVVSIGVSIPDKVTMQELNEMAQFVPSAANIHRYADVIIERYKSRLLLQVSAAITELAQDHDQSIEARVDLAQSQLTKLIDEAPRDDWVGTSDAMLMHIEVLDDRAAGKVVAWPTKLHALDNLLDGGLRPGQLIIIGARPSMGKTALAMSIGLNMAADYSVGMLSMEMSHVELRDRMTAMLGRIDLSMIKRPTKGEGLQWDRVVDATERAKTLNFYVSDQGNLNINQLRSKARALHRINGLDVLIVDYIGLMPGLDTRMSRTYQLEEVSRGLKTLAKELGIAVLCLAQVSRKVEDRIDSMPTLSDLRDCGAIEQDADTVLFMHRPIQSRPELPSEWTNYAKCTIPKNRNGKCGVFALYYNSPQTRFDSWSGEVPAKAVTSKAKEFL